ncbi:MAG: HlyD family secretion protein, partial [Terriglobales bacterium]
MEASLKTSESDTQAQQAALITAQADVKRTAALLDQAKQDWERAQSLYRDKLISRADFDSKQAAYESALAQNQLSLAKVNETRAQIHSAVTRIAGSRANLQRVSDLLAKTAFQSPLDGLVTYLPVHVGETVVPGIQNQPGSVIMRVADMSVVTAELKVDESDIVNVKLGQPVSLLIDAYGDRKFPATVTEVGDTAILRSTGQAASSSSGSASQDAKDFKVVVTLNNPPADMKPGLS